MATKAVERKAPLDHLQAEAKQKLDPARSEAVEIDWEGVTIYVLPVMDWKASALRALREGDMDSWAEKSLTNGSYKLWRQVDPTLGQCETFFTAWGEVTGESRPN